MPNPLYVHSCLLVRKRCGVCRMPSSTAARIGPIEGIWQSRFQAWSTNWEYNPSSSATTLLLALEMEKLRFRFRRVIAILFITLLSQLLFELLPNCVTELSHHQAEWIAAEPESSHFSVTAGTSLM